MCQEKICIIFKCILYFCLLDLIISLHLRPVFFVLIEHCVLIPNITTPRLTACESTETDRTAHSSNFIWYFPFPRGMVTSNSGRLMSMPGSAVQWNHTLKKSFSWKWFRLCFNYIFDFVSSQSLIPALSLLKNKQTPQINLMEIKPRRELIRRLAICMEKKLKIKLLTWNTRLRKVIYTEEGECLCLEMKHKVSRTKTTS